MTTDTIEDEPVRRTLARWNAVTEVSTRTLGAVVREVAEIMALQAEMAAGVSEHIRLLDGESGAPVSRAHLEAAIATTQKEDIIRQHQEHVTAVLVTLLDALASMRAEADETAGPVAPDAALAAHWTRFILDAQSLHDVRARFAAALDADALYPPGHHSSPASDDDDAAGSVELF